MFNKVKSKDLFVKRFCLTYELVIYSFNYIFFNSDGCMEFCFSDVMCALLTQIILPISSSGFC